MEALGDWDLSKVRKMGSDSIPLDFCFADIKLSALLTKTTIIFSNICCRAGILFYTYYLQNPHIFGKQGKGDHS